MSEPPDHLWTSAALLALTVALPLLLLTLGAFLVAIISTCCRNPTRQKHTLKVIRELTSLAKVLRTRSTR